MDVRCERCQTEYEFDDALVSERGTSVKCTNCGQQFKVYKPRAAGNEPDAWSVRTGDGREYVYTSLRELQKAILARQVSRGDRLSRAGQTRVLGAIPELVPFFEDADRGGSAPTRPRRATPAGLGLPPATAGLQAETNGAGPIGMDLGPTAGSVVMPLKTALSAPRVPQQTPSLREILDADPPTVPIPVEDDPPTRRRQPGDGPGPAPAAGAPAPTLSSAVHDAPVQRRSFRPPPEPEGLYTPPPPDAMSEAMASGRHSYDEPLPSRGSRGGAARLVVAVVLLGTLGVLGATVGRKWLEEQGQKSAPTAASSDARVDESLRLGERALAENDLEAAKEHLIKASALAERDRRVLVALARLEATRADVAWLRLRLLPESVKDARAVAKTQLDDAARRAKVAADRAAEVAPDDPAVTRAKVDALRLADDRAVARTLAPRLSSGTLAPETAYVLAALDLGESSPPWPTVLERLRLAATAETTPGRARAALVYALVRSGDAAGAKAEVERMASSPRPHPLLAELRAFVPDPAAGGDAGVKDAGADGAAPDGGRPMDVAALPAVGGGAPAVGAAPGGGGVAVPAGEPKGGDEFSEAELQKRLFGEHAPDKGKAPAQPAKKKPDIDTSDLPGVTPP